MKFYFSKIYLLVTGLFLIFFCLHSFNLQAQGNPNILVDYPNFNPGFETNSSNGLWGGSSVTSEEVHSGNKAALLKNNSQWGGGFELLITGLKPSTAYELSAYVKVSKSDGKGQLIAKESGTEDIIIDFSNTKYEKKSLKFITGLTANSAKIAIYNPIGNSAFIYADDLSLMDVGPSDPVSLIPLDKTDYKLIWSDEFETDGAIDKTKWVVERGFKRNNEEQYYHPDNLMQKNGNLIISGIRKRFRNEHYDASSSDWRKNRAYANWTSGSINTAGKFDFLYGRVECRAKVTNLPGTWPAIWTVGQKAGKQTVADKNLLVGCQTDEWPAGGEIDILENYGDGILANFAVANRGQWNAKWDARKVMIKDFGDPNWTQKFHIWTLEWTKDHMKIYVDGIFLNEMNPNTANSQEAAACPGNAPFKNTPQLLWLNLALGGNAGGNTDALPDTTNYLVDYIRVYQLKKNLSSIEVHHKDKPSIISLYPNPTNRYLNINIEERKKYQYYISSIDGKIVLSGSIQNDSQLDLFNLSSGIYFFTIPSIEQVAKFIITKRPHTIF